MDSVLPLTGVFPALLGMWYFDRLDAKRPEPAGSLRRVALAGALCTIPVIVFGLILMRFTPQEPIAHSAYEAFVLAAGVEELAKLLCVYWFVWKRPEFDERMDGIVYGARAGLGFALVENVLYLWSAMESGNFALVYIARALLAVPGHALWAGLMGYIAARRRFDGVGPGLLGGLLVAVALHGVYDFALFVQARTPPASTAAQLGLLAVPIVVIWFSLTWLRRAARRAVALDDAAQLAMRPSAQA